MELGFVAIILFIYLVTRSPPAIIKGKLGELKVAYNLQKHLPSDSYQEIIGVRAETNTSRSNFYSDPKYPPQISFIAQIIVLPSNGMTN